jgi:hypothetical protein
LAFGAVLDIHEEIFAVRRRWYMGNETAEEMAFGFPENDE